MVKFAPEEAKEAQWRSRGIAYSFFNSGAKWGG